MGAGRSPPHDGCDAFLSPQRSPRDDEDLCASVERGSHSVRDPISDDDPIDLDLGGRALLHKQTVQTAGPREIGIETIYQDLSLVDDLDVTGNFFLGGNF